MRLIDADGLLQSLAVAFDTFDPRFLRDRSIREGLKLAKTAICEAKTINTKTTLHEPWISVEDRLPEPCKDVLTWTVGGKIVINSKLHYGWALEGNFEPTHWIPLPEPPKEA